MPESLNDPRRVDAAPPIVEAARTKVEDQRTELGVLGGDEVRGPRLRSERVQALPAGAHDELRDAVGGRFARGAHGRPPFVVMGVAVEGHVGARGVEQLPEGRDPVLRPARNAVLLPPLGPQEPRVMPDRERAPVGAVGRVREHVAQPLVLIRALAAPVVVEAVPRVEHHHVPARDRARVVPRLGRPVTEVPEVRVAIHAPVLVARGREGRVEQGTERGVVVTEIDPAGGRGVLDVAEREEQGRILVDHRIGHRRVPADRSPLERLGSARDVADSDHASRLVRRGRRSVAATGGRQRDGRDDRGDPARTAVRCGRGDGCSSGSGGQGPQGTGLHWGLPATWPGSPVRGGSSG